jgi:hypothetical protein
MEHNHEKVSGRRIFGDPVLISSKLSGFHDITLAYGFLASH